MRGFSGYFAPIQLLSLWDLIIAYDSMEVKRWISVVGPIKLWFMKKLLFQIFNEHETNQLCATIVSV